MNKLILLIILGLTTPTAMAWSYKFSCNKLTWASKDAQFKYNTPFFIKAETTASGIYGSGVINYPSRAKITILKPITYKARLPGVPVTWSPANYVYYPQGTVLLADGIKYNAGLSTDREVTAARRVTAANTKDMKSVVYTNPGHPKFGIPGVMLHLTLPGKPVNSMAYDCSFIQ